MRLLATTLTACFVLSLISPTARADNFQSIESTPVDELWLNAGFYSYHFQKNIYLDNNNFGLGFEYRYSSISSVTAGRFHNSDKEMSNYAAWCWQPWALGPVRIGALLGAINGYPKAFDRAWFPLALPLASVEYKNFGLNFTIVPTYKETLHGSITLQLKVKLD
jgi:hypothetical protein